MSNEGNNASNGSASQSGSQPVSFATKAGYIGTGVLVGLIAYPFVRKALGKAQPKLDAIFDGLTGKAEDFAERASDIMAQARAKLATSEDEESHDHS